MSCICQYFVPLDDGNVTESSTTNLFHTEEKIIRETSEDKGLHSSPTTDVSATDLAAARAEIWLLNKQLTESQISIENLENLIKTIIDKENEMLKEMYHLKRINGELQDECRMQRDYHTMERNAMIMELHEVKTLLSKRSKLLEETVHQNTELKADIQDANEKIYLISMKFLRLKSLRSRHSSEQPNSTESSDQEESE